MFTRTIGALTCLALVCLLALIPTPSGALEERFVEYKHQSERINHADLRAKLERRKDRAGVTIEELVDLLRRTKGKDVERVVLNQFSVNQLLKMNDFKTSECSADEHQRRQKDCANLSPNRALLSYCKTLAAEFDQWCLYHANDLFEHALKSNGFTQEMASQVEDLRRKVLAESGKQKAPKLDLAIESVIKAQGKDFEDQILATCEKMVKIMSEVYLLKSNSARYNKVVMFYPNTWTLPYNYCRVVTHLGHPGELSRVSYNV